MAAADEQLAGEYGVSGAVVESLRKEHLTEGEHWHRDTTGRVVILPPGLAALACLLDPQKKIGGGGPDKRPVALPIARIMPNPTWVRVRLPDGSGTDIRVRDNKRLQPRMLLACLQHDDGRWECQQRGQAVPLKPLASNEAQTVTATE